jgi:DNA-binding PadR family transcriptional regulator
MAEKKKRKERPDLIIEDETGSLRLEIKNMKSITHMLLGIHEVAEKRHTDYILASWMREYVPISPISINRYIITLQKAGLVEKIATPVGNAKMITLTKRGKEAVDHLLSFLETINAHTIYQKKD